MTCTPPASSQREHVSDPASYSGVIFCWLSCQSNRLSPSNGVGSLCSPFTVFVKWSGPPTRWRAFAAAIAYLTRGISVDEASRCFAGDKRGRFCAMCLKPPPRRQCGDKICRHHRNLQL